MPIGDLKAAAIIKLIDHDGVYALVAGRVHDKSTHEEQTIIFPAIFVSVIGGPSMDQAGSFVRPAIQLQIYSQKDYAEAWRIAHQCDLALVKQRLEHINEDGVKTVGVPQRQQIGQENFDPDQKADYVTIQLKTPMVESASE